MQAAVDPQAQSLYGFKPSPYSSHSLILASLPERGEGRRVLDVGCGEGHLASILSTRGYRVTAIDSRPLETGAGIEWIRADLDSGLPPLAGGFDFVLCADILEHLREPARLLNKLRHLLADGGAVLASLPNSGHAYFRWNVLLGRFPAHDRGLFDRTHLHFYTWDGWVSLFARAGLRIESVRASGVPVGLALPGWETTGAVYLLERLSFESARLWKRLFAYQFIITARPGPHA